MKKLLCMLLLACLALTGCAAESADTGGDELTAVFLDVGKADAILLYNGEMAALIDAGENDDGDAVVEAIRARGIERLDLMIITHFDKDHVGGADKVLEQIEVARVLEPGYEKDSKQVRQYREALAAAGVEAEALTENVEFTLGGCGFAIDVANADNYGSDEENDFSLVTRLTHGGVRFLFAGDAENARLAELLDEGDLDSDVLKVPHHGRYERLSAAFFAAVSPQYAVVASSQDDLEDAETVYALQAAGAQVLLTRNGAVEIVSDGESARLARP